MKQTQLIALFALSLVLTGPTSFRNAHASPKEKDVKIQALRAKIEAKKIELENLPFETSEEEEHRRNLQKEVNQLIHQVRILEINRNVDESQKTEKDKPLSLQDEFKRAGLEDYRCVDVKKGAILINDASVEYKILRNCNYEVVVVDGVAGPLQPAGTTRLASLRSLQEKMSGADLLRLTLAEVSFVSSIDKVFDLYLGELSLRRRRRVRKQYNRYIKEIQDDRSSRKTRYARKRLDRELGKLVDDIIEYQATNPEN